MSGGISTAEPKGKEGRMEGAHAVGSSHNDRRRGIGKSDESGIPSNKGRGEESPQKNLTERSFNMDQFMSP